MSTKRSCLVALGMILGVLLVIPSTAMAWWGDWTGVPNDTNIGYTFSSCGYGNCRYIYAHNTACTARGYWGTWNTGFGWSGRGWIHNDFLVPSTNATSGIHLRVRNSGGGTWGDAAINECSYSCAWIATVDGETNNIWDYQGCYINCNDSYTTCKNECGSSITGLGPIHMYGDKWVYLNDWTCLGGYGSSSVSDTANRSFAWGEAGAYLYPAIDNSSSGLGNLIINGLGYNSKKPGRVTTGDCGNVAGGISLNFKGNAASYGNCDNCDGYGFAWVYSPSGAGPRFNVGSDDGNRVWVNGILINDNNSYRGLTRDQDRISATGLPAGWSRVLFKVHNGGGGFEGTVSLKNGGDDRQMEPSVSLQSDRYGGFSVAYEQDAWYPRIDVASFEGLSNPQPNADVYTNDTTITASGTASVTGSVPLWKVMQFQWGYGITGNVWGDVSSSGASWSHSQSSVTGHRRFHFFSVSRSGRTSYQNSGLSGGWNWADGGPGNYMDVYVDNVVPQAPSFSSVTAAGTTQINLTWAIPLDQGVNIAAGSTEAADETSNTSTNHYRRGDVGVRILRGGSTEVYAWGTGTSDSDTGLSANTAYTYTIAARDNTGEGRGAWHNTTSYVGSTTKYTLQVTPTAPVISNVTTTGMTVTTGGPVNLTDGSSGVIFNRNTVDLSKIQTLSINESGLTANTQYTYKAKGVNGDNIATGYSSTTSIYTLSEPPTANSVTASPSPACPNKTVTWTAVGGFGNGKVQYYRYVFDQNATCTFNGNETQWSSGTLSTTPTNNNTWYLHVQGYNGDNVANGTYTYTLLMDTTPPTVTCKPFTVSLNASGEASISPSDVYNTGSDNCGTVNLVSVTPNAFTCANLGTNTVTLTVDDGNGNTATCQGTVTVQDNIPPTVTCREATVFLDANGHASISPSDVFLSGWDNCGTVNKVSVVPNVFTCTNLGPNTVMLTVNDGHGNNATCQTTVTVRDDIAPTVMCQNITRQLNGTTVSITPAEVFDSVKSSDNCGTVTVESVTPNVFTCSNLGPNTVTLTVNDGHGNTATCQGTVTIEDKTAPTVSCLNITRELVGNTLTIQPNEVFNTGADECGTVNVVSVEPSTFDCTKIGDNTVTLTINDGHGNNATCTATVTVKDATPPQLALNGETGIQLQAWVDTYMENGASATDNCDEPAAAMVSGMVDTYTVGTYTITYAATDLHGNEAVPITRLVQVVDTLAPAIASCAPDLTISTNAGCEATGVSLGAPVANELCSSPIMMTNDAPASFQLGITAVTWTVTDALGNAATCQQQVTVNDTEPPVVTCPANVTVSTDSSSCKATNVDLGTPTVSDNCPGDLSVTNNAPAEYAVGLTTITWTVTDAHGNTTTCDQVVTVKDMENPTVACPSDIVVTTASGACSAAVTYSLPVANDNCPGVSVSCTPPSGSTFQKGATPVTCTAVDTAGNTTVCSFNVTVQDMEAPAITAPADVTVSTDAGSCTSASVMLGTPTTADNCEVANVTNNAPASFPKGTTVVTWTVTDTSGNSATATQNVTVKDTEKPTITCPAHVTVSTDAGSCVATNVALGTPITGDNCEVANVTNNAPASFPKGMTTVTWIVTDTSGNSATCDQAVTVNDNENPTITCSADIVATTEPGLCSAVVTFDPPVAADNCPGVTANCTPPSGSAFKKGVTTVTCTATDAVGNTGVCTFKVTVKDEEKPTIAPPSDITVSTNTGSCEAANVQLGTPSTADNCAGPLEVTNDAPAVFPKGETTVKWTVTDTSGNSASATQKVTVNDTEKPSITAPVNVAVSTDPGSCAATNVDLGTPTTADNCAVAGVTNDAPASFPKGMTTVIWTITDTSGNTASAEQKVTVNDTENPTITPPDDITVSMDPGSCVATNVQLGTPMIADNCGVSVVTNNAPTSFPKGITTVTWTVTDTSGNAALGQQTVLVNDTENPTITCPASMTLTTDPGSCEATGVNLGTATTSDNCTVTSVTNDALSSFPKGTTTVTWMVTDGSGNTATCTQEVTVNDAEKPVITLNGGDLILETGLSVYEEPGASAIDNCDQSVSVDIGGDVVTTWIFGTYIVRYDATDSSGNAAVQALRTVQLVDTVPPAITNLPNDLTVECEGPSGVPRTNTAIEAWLNQPAATDACDGLVLLTNDAPEFLALGTTVVTWRTQDKAGHEVSASRNLIVVDTTKPTIACPANVVVTTDPGSCEATNVDLGTPVTDDTCSGVASVTNNAPSSFPKGITVVTWTVTDASGNASTCDQTVTVNDAESPTITCPANITATTEPGMCSAVVTFDPPMATDNCPGVTASCTPPSGSTFQKGTTAVTCTAIDLVGNTVTCSFTVTVGDEEHPTIVAPADVTVVTDVGSCAATGVLLGTPTTADNCAVASVTNDAPSSFPKGITVVTWTVTDTSGNSTTATQKVTVNDPEKPTITAPADVTVVTDLESCAATNVQLGSPVTADNCEVASVVNDAPASFPKGITTVIWTVTDTSGNSATATQKVTVNDAEPPAITCPDNILITTDAGSCEATNVVLGDALTSDNCGIASVANNALASYPKGTTTVTWTVVDTSGNSATCVQTVSVTDEEKPTITAPADVTVSTDAGSCAATGVALGTPTTADNCEVASVTHNAPSSFPKGTTTVMWTVADTSGNIATAMQKVTVNDTEKPKITCAPDITVSADPGSCQSTGVNLGTPAISDNCPGPYALVNNALSSYPLGATTVTWTVTDTSGLSSSCEQKVTVKDTEKPVISLIGPNLIILEAAVDMYTEQGATAADNCDTSVEVVIGGNTVNPNVVGTYVVTYDAADAAGNHATQVLRTVKVMDTIPPTFTQLPADLTVECEGPPGVPKTNAAIAAFLAAAKASDACDGSIPVTNDAPDVFPLGPTTVTWTAKDLSGNMVTASREVTVVDTTKPTITCPANPAPMSADLNCAAVVPDLVSGTTATDLCGNATVTQNIAAGTLISLGETVVMLTANDGHGNSATCPVKLTVVDTTPPVITCPADIAVSDRTGGTPVTYTPTATDNCDPHPLVQTSIASGSLFNKGVTAVTATATDATGGNSSTCTFNVTTSCFAVNKLKVRTKEAPVPCQGLSLLEVTSDQGVFVYTKPNQDKLGADTEVTDGVNPKVKIHTGCDRPPSVGEVFGPYTVTRVESLPDIKGVSLLEVTSNQGVFVYIKPNQDKLGAETAVNDGVSGEVKIQTNPDHVLNVGMVFGPYTVTNVETLPDIQGYTLLQVTSDQGVFDYVPQPGQVQLGAETAVNDGVNGEVKIQTNRDHALKVGMVFGPYTVTDVDMLLVDYGPDNKIDIHGSFSPGTSFDPITTPVTYTVDDGQGHTFTYTITAGSFKIEGNPADQKYRYHSPKGVDPRIKAKFFFVKDHCKFEFKIKPVYGTPEIVGTTLTVTVKAGVNVGQDVLSMDVKADHLESKLKPEVHCCP